MEALVAVGLAANIAQFVQQACTLISEAKSIRETGSPRSLPELRGLTDDLLKQADSIRKCLSSSITPLIPEEQNLIQIADECQKAGKQFIGYIDTLINSTDCRRSRYLTSSIKYQFKQKKIEDFFAKLEKLRNALTLAAVLTIRASATTNHKEIIQRLDQSQQERIANDDALQNAIRILSNAILSETMPKLDILSNQLQQYATKVGEIRQNTIAASNSKIIQWLDFRQISWRYDEIPLAYQETYSWIFRKPGHAGTWDDFTVYLKNNATAPYFINGKAGSGKSTLMKFITDHQCTKDYLDEWAGLDNSTLVMAKFFFWNAGTPLQKSTSGLLRGLLKVILNEHPDLIPVVLPEMFSKYENLPEEPGYLELKRAWEILLLNLANFSLKLAIFIDGVDEFEGDHKDVAEFVKCLASERVKVIVSSRPVNACLQTFKQCPTIRLQDLTKKDMEIFVQGKLSSHPRMLQLSQSYPLIAEDITKSIKEKADGVFLWVKLVVWLLVRGLEDGDTVEDLIKRLRSLPGDLRTLYRHMLSRMSPGHQIQAAEIFQIVAASQNISKQPLQTLTLNFALQPPSSSLELEIRPADEKTLPSVVWYHQQTSARVRSRCCGLVETRARLWIDGSDDHPREVAPLDDHPLNDVLESTVTYLHRTVAEFLTSDDIALQLQHLVNPMFNPYENLMAACLCRLKTSKEIRLNGHKVHDHLEYMLQLYQAAPAQFREKLNPYLHAFNEVMVYYEGETWFQKAFEGKGHIPRTFLEFTARLGFYEYLKNCSEIASTSASRLVIQALESWSTRSEIQFQHVWFNVPLQDRRDTLALLLNHVVTLQDQLLEKSLFEFTSKYVVRMKHSHNIILPIFLMTTKSVDFLNMYSISKWRAMVKCLVKSGDPENRSLAHKTSQILAQHYKNDYQDPGHDYGESAIFPKGSGCKSKAQSRSSTRSRAKQLKKGREETLAILGDTIHGNEEEEWVVV